MTEVEYRWEPFNICPAPRGLTAHYSDGSTLPVVAFMTIKNVDEKQWRPMLGEFVWSGGVTKNLSRVVPAVFGDDYTLVPAQNVGNFESVSHA